MQKRTDSKRKSKTNPIPEGTDNVSINMRKEIKKLLSEAARKNGLSLSAYVRAILLKAVSGEIVVELSVRQEP